MQNNFLKNEIVLFSDSYIKMKVGNGFINCPYWRNRIKDGKVVIRGYLNGKGEAVNICIELNRIINESKMKNDNIKNLSKIAKRNRIGIDCSGLAYRLLDIVVKSEKKGKSINLDCIFKGGINKTNVKRLTSPEYAIRIEKIQNIMIGDMIRMMSGKHVLVVIDVDKNAITYLHSSSLNTKIKGVHKGKIIIENYNKQIEFQIWQELTEDGKSYGGYMDSLNGDGVYRLKILI